MISIGAVLALCSLVCGVLSRSTPDLDWQNWKQLHAKVYSTPAEEQAKYEVWLNRRQEVDQHNALYESGLTTYSKSINRFSDMDWEEFGGNHLLESGKVDRLSVASVEQNKSPAKQSFPLEVNWVELGHVTPVKDEGECRCAWAFAAVGALEGQLPNLGHNLTDLSVQQLVDCSTEDDGCMQGKPEVALQYTMDEGITSATNYPYEAKNDTCSYNASMKIVQNTGVHYVTYAYDWELTRMVAQMGPTATKFFVSEDFITYSGGIFNTTQCPPMMTNHAVLVVGYGVENGTDFWLVKNSWGDQWGEAGFFRLARDQDNLCGIALEPVVPTFDELKL